MSPIDQTYLAEPETRVTNEGTGGQKGAKLTQVGALDPVSLIELARIAGMGAAKYSAYNFMKGTDWSLMFNAAQRHLLRFWSGEDRDPESGQLHAAHAAWLCLALVGFSLRETGNDDRPPALAEPGLPAGIINLSERRHERLLNGEQPCCGYTRGHAIDCANWVV